MFFFLSAANANRYQQGVKALFEAVKAKRLQMSAHSKTYNLIVENPFRMFSLTQKDFGFNFPFVNVILVR